MYVISGIVANSKYKIQAFLKEMGQLVSSNSVPHFCRTFGVYAVHLLFYKMPHEAGMRTR